MNNWMKSLTNIGLPQSFHITYIVEILILTVIIYELLIWVKNTRAWTLLKGIVVVTVFALGSYFFHLTTLTWIMSKTAGVLVTVVVIVGTAGKEEYYLLYFRSGNGACRGGQEKSGQDQFRNCTCRI